MATTFTLDDIRAAAERDYGATIFDLGETQVELVNALRLPETRRKKLLALQEEMGKDDPKDEDGNPIEGEESRETKEVMFECLRLVAANEKTINALIDVVQDDLALTATVFKMYVNGAEMGEASPSHD